MGGAIASRSPALFSIVAGTQVARPKHRKKAGGGGYIGARLGKHNDRSASGRWAGESPPAPVRCHSDATGQLVDVAGG